jgi:hypothetical protein
MCDITIYSVFPYLENICATTTRAREYKHGLSFSHYQTTQPKAKRKQGNQGEIFILFAAPMASLETHRLRPHLVVEASTSSAV